MTEIRTASPEATEAAGRALGSVLRAGDLLALDGPLGAGKTCLVRGLAGGLGAAEREVRSPTFVIHQVHTSGRVVLHHLDLYRLGEGASVDFLDLEELLEQGAVAVEWASRTDLSGLAPIGLSIDVTASEERVLRLDDRAPRHVAAAWR
jgi:tRNA threonylcarbamoyladenosine biosynthesis protein TsaE